ncbi:MAG: type III secretion system cytoplasmic ring protein SctQ [Chlamydiota bacterium]
MNPSDLLRSLPHVESSDPSPTKVLGPLLHFPANDFTTTLQERLNISDLSFQVGRRFWIKEEELRSWEQEKLICLSGSPIAGNVYWFLEQEAIVKLLSWTIKKDQEKAALSSPILVEGLYHYVLLEMLDTLTKTPLFSRISPKITIEKPFTGPCFAIEISLTHDREAVTGLLLLSKEFWESFHHYFAVWEKEMPKQSSRSNLPLIAHLSVGHTFLSQNKLQNLQTGDVVLLDSLDYDLNKASGSARMTLGKTPLFQVRLNNDQIEIQSRTPPENVMESPEHTPTPEQDPEDKIPLNEIPLALSIDLASVELSLKELSELSVGSSLALPDNPGHLVSLRLQGKKIATGELVSLGETFGVRILSIDYAS